MQRPDVQDDDADEHERQQVVQREEAVQRRVVDREAAPQPGGDRVAHERDGGEQVGDDRGAPEAHLAPRQHVAHESGRHHEQEDDDAEDPEHLARRLVGPVVQAAEHVDVDRDEEHRRAVGVRVADEPAPVHVAHDALDGREGVVDMGRVVHRQHDAGDDLRHEHEAQNGAERPHVVEVARRRVRDERPVHEAKDRQSALEPAADCALGYVGRRSAHVGVSSGGRCGRSAGTALARQPMRNFVSVRKSYSGTGRFAGAGPRRMRPDVS